VGEQHAWEKFYLQPLIVTAVKGFFMPGEDSWVRICMKQAAVMLQAFLRCLLTGTPGSDQLWDHCLRSAQVCFAVSIAMAE
jgi:hypothetical protein